MIKRFDKVGYLVILFLALGLFMGGECPNGDPEEPGYPPFEFEVDGQGWIVEDSAGHKGFTACEHSAEQKNANSHSLKITCDLDGGVTDKVRGNAFVEFASVIDISTKTLSAWVYIPDDADIEAVGSNAATLFVQSFDDTKTPEWVWGNVPSVAISASGIVEGQWCEISGALTSSGPGDFDLTKIKQIGFQISLSTSNTYAGPVYLDTVDWK